MDIKNKVAIITGASSGIGLATAKLLTERGAKVALVARSGDKLTELAKELPESLVVPTDMTKTEDIKSMVAKVQSHFGRIDILINNAGQGYDAPIEKINLETFRYIFSLDVVGPLAAMQEVIPLMKSQAGGAILNISSGTALLALPEMGAYSSLKRALVGLSLTAREELKGNNISVGVVYPYATATDFEKNTIKDSPGPQGQLPRPADSPDHVAKIILEGIISGQAEIFAHDWMSKQQK